MEAESKLDILQKVETPEGIELDLKTAGITTRFYAYFIDQILRIIFYMFFSYVVSAGFNFDVASGLIMIAFFIVEWFYPIIFEVTCQGATPGKTLMGLAVIYDDGTPVGWGGSMVRNFIRTVDSMPMILLPVGDAAYMPLWVYGVGVLTIIFSSSSKRLGDYAAGTIVIHTDKKRKKKSDPEKMIVDYEMAIPEVPLLLEEQKAIIDFVDRMPGFSQERRIELAYILNEMTGKSGDEGVKHLCRIGYGISEKR